MTIQCPFQTQTAVDKDWKISPACTLGETGIDTDLYIFLCEASCKVTTGALVNKPPDHFPYCEPGGQNAPTYKSGCENVQPPQPNQQSIQAIEHQQGAWSTDAKACEAKRAKGCVHFFGTVADRCKSEFEDAPTYVEGHMGVCCNKNAQPVPEPPLE